LEATNFFIVILQFLLTKDYFALVIIGSNLYFKVQFKFY